MERKILTLEEVLNLNRRPTLQEMVDIDYEEYLKFLLREGFIKYIPEDLYLYDKKETDIFLNGYDPFDDPVILLKTDDYEEQTDLFCEAWNKPKDFQLDQWEFWYDEHIIEKGIVYNTNGTPVEYIITEDCEGIIVTLYDKNSDGIYVEPEELWGYYLWYL